MTAHVLENLALKELRSTFTGEVIVPGDSGYDQARTLFNTMIDKRPSVIAQCQTVVDVARAIRFGRDLHLEIAVRCGGHGVAGTALTDGGIVIDLRRKTPSPLTPQPAPPPSPAARRWVTSTRRPSRTGWQPLAVACRPPASAD